VPTTVNSRIARDITILTVETSDTNLAVPLSIVSARARTICVAGTVPIAGGTCFAIAGFTFPALVARAGAVYITDSSPTTDANPRTEMLAVRTPVPVQTHTHRCFFGNGTYARPTALLLTLILTADPGVPAFTRTHPVRTRPTPGTIPTRVLWTFHTAGGAREPGITGTCSLVVAHPVSRAVRTRPAVLYGCRAIYTLFCTGLKFSGFCQVGIASVLAEGSVVPNDAFIGTVYTNRVANLTVVPGELVYTVAGPQRVCSRYCLHTLHIVNVEASILTGRGLAIFSSERQVGTITLFVDNFGAVLTRVDNDVYKTAQPVHELADVDRQKNSYKYINRNIPRFHI
jgi:hypothetical protein